MSSDPKRRQQDQRALVEDPDGVRSKSFLSQHSNLYPQNDSKTTPINMSDPRARSIEGLEGVNIVQEGAQHDTLYNSRRQSKNQEAEGGDAAKQKNETA